MFEINNRRYLGNKYKLLPFIKEVVEKECKDVQVVFDVFSGTGAVATAFLDKTVIVNDILYSNHLSHLTWLSSLNYDKNKIKAIIKEYNNLVDIKEENYMSENFSNTFFSYEVCKKIGCIRDDIEDKFVNNIINERERAILVTSLLYAMDKIANTCGHYDAYRKGEEYKNNFVLDMPKISDKVSSKNKCYNMDSNILAREIECDLAYLDPPYNSRQYCDAYHLLENVAKWEKPKVIGVARKMDRTSLKSDYCTSNAPKAFEELIDNLKCKYIVLSYNNTAKSANDRSNAKISDEDIFRILSKKGQVKVFSKRYKAFTTGKSNNDKNEERLFLCIVNKSNGTDDVKKRTNKSTSTSELVSSPLNYTGGKAKLLSQIKPLFPKKIDKMVDLFCGGCNVGINIQANEHYYNDINKELIGLYKTLSSLPEKTIFDKIYSIINEYGLSDSTNNRYDFYGCNSSDGLASYNKDKFVSLRADFNALKKKNDDYYIKFFTLIIFGFNNQIRFNSSGEYNLPVGKRDFNNNLKEKLRKFIAVIKAQNAKFTSIDFRKIDISEFTQDSLVYADPPYLITTAGYNENNGWTEKDEQDLLKFLDKLTSKNIKFALSNVLRHKGKINEILINWLEKNKNLYCVYHLDYNYSNSNYHTKDRITKSEEVLITNYRL